VSSASPCLWVQQALAADDAPAAPPLEGADRADVCVVGGGYVGLWTALRLRELDPSLDIVLIERDVCGSGASGRNAGFVLSWWIKLPTLRHLFGLEQALALARESARSVDEIAALCTETGIDAGLRREGWVIAATNAAQASAISGLLALSETLPDRPFVELDADELRQSTSWTRFGGALEPAAATLQPAVLARGLRRIALERGIRIYEHSPMTTLQRARPPVVVTPRGSIRADRVVIAMNAWAGRLPEISRSFVALRADAGATASIPSRLADVGWTSGAGVNDSRMLINFHRTTDDGRVVFGKGFADPVYRNRVGTLMDGASPHAHELEANLHRLLPELAAVAVETTWSGPIDRTADSLPFFCTLGGHPDIFCGLGWSGNGLGPSLIGGKILASLVLGLEDSWSASPLVRTPPAFPPEPVRYVGAHVVRAAVRAKERAEDDARPPGRITRAIAGLSPSGLVTEKRRSH
jgi:glycine/D-amino acid oxidase-like deaminating enzyme